MPDDRLKNALAAFEQALEKLGVAGRAFKEHPTSDLYKAVQNAHGDFAEAAQDLREVVAETEGVGGPR